MTDYEKISINVIGNACTMDGKELWVVTEGGIMVKIIIEDDALRWKFYCKNILITIETTEIKMLSQVIDNDN